MDEMGGGYAYFNLQFSVYNKIKTLILQHSTLMHMIINKYLKQGYYATCFKCLEDLENLEKSGISYLIEKSGNSLGILVFYPKFWKSQGIRKF